MSSKNVAVLMSLVCGLLLVFQNCARPNQFPTADLPSQVATLLLTPATVQVAAGQSTIFTASGGQAPYHFAVTAGTSTINATTGVFTASAVAESANVEVTDAANNSATAQVAVKVPVRVCVKVAENNTLTVTCPAGSKVQSVQFASYGTPTGTCGSYVVSNCNASTSLSTVQSVCLNQATCAVAATNTIFGDPCTGTAKSLAVQAVCY